jgi:hypothetical protein
MYPRLATLYAANVERPESSPATGACLPGRQDYQKRHRAIVCVLGSEIDLMIEFRNDVDHNEKSRPVNLGKTGRLWKVHAWITE